uniref:Sodium-and chloride-dependent GABA transporter 2 n=1 Tax=Magallana gigas TaxID=29159 RepID=K1QK81_MAGGI
MGKDKKSNGVDMEIQEEHADGVRKRETWTNKIDFLLACIGFSVGLGNVWRFPYLCYKNGGVRFSPTTQQEFDITTKHSMGSWSIDYLFQKYSTQHPSFMPGNNLCFAVSRFSIVQPLFSCLLCPFWLAMECAFLIPYFILVIIGGVPLFFLECSVGQFMGVSGFRAWSICPLFQGILSNLMIIKGFAFDRTNKVLNISDGIEPENMGEIKWDLALTLLFAWVVVYCCICKGIKSSGKVMYITATSPYLFMLALLIRNCLLPGARTGILFYLTPDWSRLNDLEVMYVTATSPYLFMAALLIRNALLPGSLNGVIFYLKPDLSKLNDMEVWVDAGTQIFFSYSIAIGALTALGSYNKFNHNSYRDCIIFACANSGTSFFAGFIIFTILGHMAEVQGVDIKDVAAGGPGLAFIAYPKAVSLMPGAPIWAILFFLMLILLGLDSQFVGVEGVISAVVDQWPNLLRRGYRKEIFIGIVCILNFFIGLSMVSRGGMYVFQLFDYYSGSKIILFIAFFECIAIAWIYGVRRFYDNLEMMLGFRINPYMMVSWTVLSPIFCMCVFIMSVVNYSELDYKRPTKPLYKFPTWAVGIGWGMAAFAAIWIPLMILYRFYERGISRETITYLITPQGLKNHQLRPQDKKEGTSADKYRTSNPPPYQEKGTANEGFQSNSTLDNTKL